MENIIVLNVSGNTKEEVIRNLSKVFLENDKLVDLNKYVNAVLDRENEITTGFGNGIAIPHGKSDAVKESCFIFAKLAHKVNWESMDKKDVDMVFLLAIPNEEAGTTHLRLLSRIAMAIMEESLVYELRNASSIEEIDEIIKKI